MGQEKLSASIQAARQALVEKKTDEAIALLEEFLQQLPESAEAASMLGANSPPRLGQQRIQRTTASPPPTLVTSPGVTMFPQHIVS